MGSWLTIEVHDAGIVSAEGWRRAHGEALTEAALTNGARDWQWDGSSWGVVLELEFLDEDARDRFRALPAVTAALDAVPDPVLGLVVYPGRGGSSASGAPRRPRPAPLAGAAAEDEPRDQYVELGEAIALTV